MKIKTWRSLLIWKFKDYAIFPSSLFISSVAAALSQLLLLVGFRRLGFVLLMKSDRIGPSSMSRRLVKHHKDELIKVCLSLVHDEGVDDDWIKKRSLILRDPILGKDGHVIAKGVYLVKFTTTFPFVFNALDLRKLEEAFVIVLEPSWSGYCLPEILAWGSLRNPVIVQASEVKDRELLSLINSNLVPVDFGSGDWVDPDVFYPIGAEEKQFDVIYVANFNSIKRQYVFLECLKKLRDQGEKLNAALVCGAWGDCKSQILDLIESYQLEDSICFFEELSQEELNRLLNRSKVNILLSLKEGSNRSLFEGFFSNVPGVVLSNNIGVNKSYFNESTGMCISEDKLPDAILHFREHWERFEPRKWAMDNISPKETVRKLEKAIEHYCALADGDTRPLAIKVNAPEAVLKDSGEMPRWSPGDVLKNYADRGLREGP